MRKRRSRRAGSKPRIRRRRLLRLRLTCPAPHSRRNRREARRIAGSTQVHRTGRAQRQRPAPTTPGAGRGDHRARQAACRGPRTRAVHDGRMTPDPKNLWIHRTRLSRLGQGLKAPARRARVLLRLRSRSGRSGVTGSIGGPTVSPGPPGLRVGRVSGVGRLYRCHRPHPLRFQLPAPEAAEKENRPGQVGEDGEAVPMRRWRSPGATAGPTAADEREPQPRRRWATRGSLNAALGPAISTAPTT